MLLANLQIDIGVTGAGSAINVLGQVNLALNNTANAAGGAAAGNIMSLLRTFDEFGYAARSVGQLAAAVTGVGTAASYEGIRMQIETVTGSAESAGRALNIFRDIGLSTKFETAEVARYGQQFLNLGDSVDMAGEHMRATLDLAAAGGLQRQDFGRFMTNLGQIRSGGIRGIADMRQMLSAAPGMGRILGEQMGLGRNATAQDLIGEYRKLGSGGFFDMMIQASKQPGIAGASERLTPIERVGQLFESLSVVMEPTGRIILMILTPLGIMATNLANLLGAFNRWGQGIPGLLILVYALSRGWFVVVGAIGFVRTEITRLAADLRTLAASARGASSATGAAAGRAGGIGIGRGEMIAMGVGLGLSMAGASMQGNNAQVAGSRTTVGQWGDILSNMGSGATIGAIAGSIVPGLGNALGAVIGGAVGGIGTIGAKLWQQSHPAASATDPLATAIKENTEATKAQTQAIGGGRRFRRVTGQIELEYALAAAMRI